MSQQQFEKAQEHSNLTNYNERFKLSLNPSMAKFITNYTIAEFDTRLLF